MTQPGGQKRDGAKEDQGQAGRHLHCQEALGTRFPNRGHAGHGQSLDAKRGSGGFDLQGPGGTPQRGGPD